MANKVTNKEVDAKPKSKSLSKKVFDSFKAKVTAAKKVHDEKSEDIKLWRDYYRGDQWDAGDERFKDQPTDNVIFSNIKTLIPSINFKDPRIFVRAKKKPYPTKLPTGEEAIFDTNKASMIVELILNYYYRELEIKRQIDKSLLDCLIGPWGVIQIGYTMESEVVSDDKLIQTDELIKSETPFVKRVSPLDFLVDIEAKDSHLEDASWIAFRRVRRLQDIKDDPKFINTTNLEVNVVVDVDNKSGEVNVSDKLPDNKGGDGGEWGRVEYWELWDKRSKKIISIALNHDKPIEYRDWTLDYDGGFPVETLFFNENPDELYPVSDVEIYIDSQDELNILKALNLDHVKRVSQRRYVAKEDAFQEEELDKIIHGGDGAIAFTSSESAETALVPLKDANIASDVYAVIQDHKRQIQEESGVAMIEKGASIKFETATEPSLIQQGINIRRDDRTAILEQFMKHIMRKVGKVLQQTLDKEQSFPLNQTELEEAGTLIPDKLESIVGPDGVAMGLQWINASKEDIQGEYEFSVQVGSSKPINQEIRKRDATQVFSALNGHPLVDQMELLKKTLEAFEVNDYEKLLRNPEEVAEEQEAQAQAQIEAEQAVDEPKRQTDLAKTEMKTASNEKITLMKELVNLLGSSESQTDNNQGENNAKKKGE